MKKYKENREFFLGVFIVLRSISVLIMIFVAVKTGDSSHHGEVDQIFLPALISMLSVVLTWGTEEMIREDLKKQQNEESEEINSDLIQDGTQ